MGLILIVVTRHFQMTSTFGLIIIGTQVMYCVLPLVSNQIIYHTFREKAFFFAYWFCEFDEQMSTTET